MFHILFIFIQAKCEEAWKAATKDSLPGDMFVAGQDSNGKALVPCR